MKPNYVRCGKCSSWLYTIFALATQYELCRLKGPVFNIRFRLNRRHSIVIKAHFYFLIDLLTEVKLDSREAKDIIKNIADSFWEPDAYTLEFHSIKLVYNEMLEKQVCNDIGAVKHELQFSFETSSSAGWITF